MNYDEVADNEDQLYRDLLEEEQKKEGESDSHPWRRKRNNYDDESREDQ